MCKNFMHKFFYTHMSSNLLGINLEMKLQSHMIALCLTFWVTAKLFFKVTALFSPPASKVWGLISTYPCWCLISINVFVVVILVGVKLYFFVALVWSSLMVNVLQYNCLENPMDGGAWQAAVHGVAERLHFYFSLSCIGEGNGNPLQYSCLENPRDRGA